MAERIPTVEVKGPDGPMIVNECDADQYKPAKAEKPKADDDKPKGKK